jgi:hypothetical protein
MQQKGNKKRLWEGKESNLTALRALPVKQPLPPLLMKYIYPLARVRTWVSHSVKLMSVMANYTTRGLGSFKWLQVF